MIILAPPIRDTPFYLDGNLIFCFKISPSSKMDVSPRQESNLVLTLFLFSKVSPCSQNALLLRRQCRFYKKYAFCRGRKRLLLLLAFSKAILCFQYVVLPGRQCSFYSKYAFRRDWKRLMLLLDSSSIRVVLFTHWLTS